MRTSRSEAEGHEVREADEADDDEQIDPELGPAAGSVTSRHVSLLSEVEFAGGRSSRAPPPERGAVEHQSKSFTSIVTNNNSNLSFLPSLN